ncbi:MAG: dihydrofolate reductase family protein [Thermoanaerobaculia bacterium]
MRKLILSMMVSLDSRTAGPDGDLEWFRTDGDFTSKEREIAFAERMNTLPKIVYSRTLSDPAWGPATVVRDVRAEDVMAMKREPGKDLVLFAGATLASAFADLDLIDEYRLMIHPIVLGRGLPLFDGVADEHPLRLIRATTFSSGVVLLHHARERG